MKKRKIEYKRTQEGKSTHLGDLITLSGKEKAGIIVTT